MEEIRQGNYEGERSLFGAKSLRLIDTVFHDGESPLKESRDIELERCSFQWKYPLWYSDNITADNTTWLDGARAGVWYSNNIKVSDCIIEAPKNFRRCRNLVLSNVYFSDARETLWSCEDVKLSAVRARGDYFAMNCINMEVDDLSLSGNYSFDGARELIVKNSRLLSKDAFWNSENVTVINSCISGEYLGWNSRNLTFIDCTIESLQGLCYIDNLVMKNCRLNNTTLAFEYSSVDADIKGKIDSVFNPGEGTISADHIDNLIIEKDKVDPGKTRIIIKDEQNV